MSKKLVVVAISRDEARVWKSSLDPHTEPDAIRAPMENVHHHVRIGQFHRGHDTDHMSSKYFEEIALAIHDADEILLIGHGKGKASYTLHLTQYLERKHPDVAQKVVDALAVDLENLSEGEILDLAREWQDQHALM